MKPSLKILLPIFSVSVTCMLFFKAGRDKTASLRKIRQLHEGTEWPAASKGQKSWKPRKATPQVGVPAEGALGQQVHPGKARNIKAIIRPMMMPHLNITLITVGNH